MGNKTQCICTVFLFYIKIFHKECRIKEISYLFFRRESMKKLYFVFLVFTVLFSLTACSSITNFEVKGLKEVIKLPSPNHKLEFIGYLNSGAATDSDEVRGVIMNKTTGKKIPFFKEYEQDTINAKWINNHFISINGYILDVREEKIHDLQEKPIELTKQFPSRTLSLDLTLEDKGKADFYYHIWNRQSFSLPSTLNYKYNTILHVEIAKNKKLSDVGKQQKGLEIKGNKKIYLFAEGNQLSHNTIFKLPKGKYSLFLKGKTDDTKKQNDLYLTFVQK